MNPRVSVQVQPTSDWNPSLYMKFADERMLAARDLLARVPLASARLVYDLGCGPGNSAELLSRRFPDADVIGLDTSEAMLDNARTRAPRARFVRQNIVDWVANGAAEPNFRQRRVGLPLRPPCALPPPRCDARARRCFRRADALDGARILACAHADGRGRGALVVATGASRQDPAPDRRVRGLLRVAAASRCTDRHVDDDLRPYVRRAGR